MTCKTCDDNGFVMIKRTKEVVPCPTCNPDGMPLEDPEVTRCGNPRGGGGRTCYLELGHGGDCAFECGR